MASLKKRGNKYVVVYGYNDATGKRHQKWESFLTKEEATKFKKKIEYEQASGKMLAPTAQTVGKFLQTWAELYGKSKWSFSMCTNSLMLIRTHITPEIGEIPLQQVKPMDIEIMFNHLRVKKCRGAKAHVKEGEEVPCLSSSTLHHIYTLLKTAFDKAVEWKLIESNPVICDAPKKLKVERNIWTPEMIRTALDNIHHPLLHLAVHLAFICSLRIGETVALTWNDIDFDNRLIHIRRTLQRVNKESLALIPQDDLLLQFPPRGTGNSILVLKRPKTPKSRRIVYMTPNLCAEIAHRQQQVAKEKDFIGEEYHDFNLVFCSEEGYPIEPKLCEKWFKQWQKRNNLGLPPLIFHDIRHSSETYKLLESEGDTKLVQGDLGHATADMTVETYAHTQEARRRAPIDKIAESLYSDNASASSTTPQTQRMESPKQTAETSQPAKAK